jgi:hypothetical protein
MLVIRLIKKHSHSDKVFIQDLKEYLEMPKSTSLLEPELLSSPHFSHKLSQSAGVQPNQS